MSKLKEMTKDQLILMKKFMEQYIEGCMDTYEIIESIKNQTHDEHKQKMDYLNRLLEEK